MTPSPAVRGVLFDTGNTLTRPRGGRWNPRYDFEDVLLRHEPGAPVDRFPDAFAVGAVFLDASPSTSPREDYHRAILRELGYADPSPELLRDLDLPLDLPPIEPFLDVLAVLHELRSREIRMALVTDNWGTSETIRRMHDLIGLEGFFDAVIVSEELGCRKPDPRMYHAARDALDLRSEECLFVDDDPDLVEAAVALGFRGVTICRDGTPEPQSGRSITELGELVRLL